MKLRRGGPMGLSAGGLLSMQSAFRGDIEAIVSGLREQGVRITRARRAVISVLASENAHQSAEDLATAVDADQPGVHRSTIYRTLDSLEKLGVVEHLHLGNGRAVYHLSADPHRHLLCESCGHVVHASADLFDQLAAEILDRYGFRVRPDHFGVGRCRGCVRGALSAP